MLTEYEVRNALCDIDRLEVHPIRKARAFIVVANRVRRQAFQLSEGARILSRDGQDEQAGRLIRRRTRMFELVEEVLNHARTQLAENSTQAAASGRSTARTIG